MNKIDWKIINGDALAELPRLADNSIDFIITDPPYGISYQSAWRIDRSKRFDVIANDGEPFIEWISDAFRITKEKGALICFCRWDVQERFKNAIEKSGWSVKSQVIWDREIHGLGDLKRQFAPQHDIIWFATKGDFTFPFKRPKSVLRYQRIGGNELLHPNQKPTALMSYLVKTLTKPFDVILDPFAGSFTTGVACAIENRNFIGIEINPEYCAFGDARIHRALGEPCDLPRRMVADKSMPLFEQI